MMKFIQFVLFAVMITVSSIEADINTDLVAQYDFDDNLNDTVGNANGVDDGETLLYTAGVFNQGLIFDSYPDLVKFDTATFLQGEVNTTVAMWIRTTNSNTQGGVLSANTGSSNQYLIYIYGGKLSINLHNKSYPGNKVINDLNFHHISVTTSDTEIAIYVDGELDKKYTIKNTPITFASYVWLGNEQDSTNGGWEKNQQFYGVLDDLRIYHRTMSVNDIKELYELGKAALVPPKLSYADVIVDSYYSHANSDFSNFYGGDKEGGPKLVPVTYAADGDVTTAVSLPTDSYITVGFSKYSIRDVPNADDIYIVEGGAGGEDAKVYVSSDFVNFVYLGLAQDDVTTSLDLASINFTDPVVAIKIVGQDSGGSWPGFDLFDVKGLPGALVEDDTQCKKVIKIYGKSPHTGKWILFSTPCDVPSGWITSQEKPSNTMCNSAIVIML